MNNYINKLLCCYIEQRLNFLDSLVKYQIHRTSYCQKLLQVCKSVERRLFKVKACNLSQTIQNVSEYDQEIPQSYTADQPTAP